VSRNRSCEGGNDGELGKAGGGGDGDSADAGEAVAIAACDSFEDAELAEVEEPAGDGCRRERCEREGEVGRAHVGDIEGGALESLQQSLIEQVEEIEAFDRLVGDAMRPGEAIEGFEAGGEIIEGGQEGQVAAVAGAEDVARVVEAVDGLLERGEGAAGPLRCSTLPWRLKAETSLLLVSRRSTRANLSYILIVALP
jgi:hypothetical protein